MPTFKPSSDPQPPFQRHRRRAKIMDTARAKWRAFRAAWAAAMDATNAAPNGPTQAHRRTPSPPTESANDRSVSAWLAAQAQERISDHTASPQHNATSSRPDPRHTYIQVWQHGDPEVPMEAAALSGVQMSTQYVRPRREPLAQSTRSTSDSPAQSYVSSHDRPRHTPIIIPDLHFSSAALMPTTTREEDSQPPETPTRPPRPVPPKLSEVSLPSNFTAPTVSPTSRRHFSIDTSRSNSIGLYSTGNVFSLAEWDRLPDIRPDNRPQSSGPSFPVPVTFILLHPCPVLELDAECKHNVLQIASEMVRVVESWHTHQTMDLLIRRAGEILRLGPGCEGRQKERWRYCFAAEGARDEGRQSFESLVRGSQEGGWRWIVYLIEVEKDARGQWSSLR